MREEEEARRSFPPREVSNRDFIACVRGIAGEREKERGSKEKTKRKKEKKTDDAFRNSPVPL